MENSELFRMFNEQLTSRLDKMEVRIYQTFERFDGKLDRLFSERNAICQDHNERIDSLFTSVKILEDRQRQNEEQSKRRLTIIGFLVALFNIIVSSLLALLGKNYE